MEWKGGSSEQREEQWWRQLDFGRLLGFRGGQVFRGKKPCKTKMNTFDSTVERKGWCQFHYSILWLMKTHHQMALPAEAQQQQLLLEYKQKWPCNEAHCNGFRPLTECACVS